MKKSPTAHGEGPMSSSTTRECLDDQPRPARAVPSSGRPRILSGVQSSGKLHIGNYFGAIKQHIERQDSGDCFYFIADYHALTTLCDNQPDIRKRGPQLRELV